MTTADPNQAAYPFHSGARTAYIITAVLCLFLFVTIPLSIWIFIRLGACKVTVTSTGVNAKGIFSNIDIPFAEVQRLGYLQVPVIARGIGGVIARKKVGGDNATHLCVMDSKGKTRKFMASMYENHHDMFNRVSWATQRPVEQLEVGLVSPKWPPAQAPMAQHG